MSKEWYAAFAENDLSGDAEFQSAEARQRMQQTRGNGFPHPFDNREGL